MNKLTNSIIKNVVKKLTYAVLLASMAFSAWATSLDDAKQQGLVGEMPNGYLGVVVESPEVNELVSSVNEKRKSIYLNLARKNNITMEQITALAGEKAINKTQSGHLIKTPEGKWVAKK